VTASSVSEVRSAIRKRFPHLKFEAKTVSFVDLGRGRSVCVMSKEWGMTKAGSSTLFLAVREVCREHGAVAIW
jgi:hypothetical protein